MTNSIDPLDESLRLLRETSLPGGFEGRLAERLVAVDRPKVLPFRRAWGPRRVALLLAAVSLPAAAFASGGWLLVNRLASEPTAAHPIIAATAEHLTVSRAIATSTPITLPPAPPAILPTPALPEKAEPKRPAVVPQSPPRMPRSEIERTPRKGGSESVKSADTERGLRASAQPSIESVAAEAKPIVTPSAQTAPEKVESLDIEIRHREPERTTIPRAAERPREGARLRDIGDRSIEGPGGARERERSRMEGAGEHRGKDGAQQARERVQARERKGQ